MSAKFKPYPSHLSKPSVSKPSLSKPSSSKQCSIQSISHDTLFTVDKLSVQSGEKTLLNINKLEIRSQKLTSFIGPNGAGKSTLLHSLLNYHGGSALKVTGDIKCTAAAYSELTRQGKIAWVGQHERYELPLTVIEYALLGVSPQLMWYQAPNQQHMAIATDLLTDFELGHLYNSRVTTLSGGEKQRLSIVRALMQDTPILMLDEPTNHLDIRHQRYLLCYLRDLVKQQQKTVLVVLHDLTQAYRYSDNVVLLHQGTLVAEGEPNNVMTQERLSDVYRVDIETYETKTGKVFV